MNTKVLIICGGVLVVLFLVSVSSGLVRETNAPDDLSPGWLEPLNRTEPLTAADISSALPQECADQFADGRIRLRAGSNCILRVGPSDSFLPKSREIGFRLLAGQETELTARQPDSLTVRHELGPGDDESFEIFDEGGSIVVRCNRPGPTNTCEIRVG